MSVRIKMDLSVWFLLLIPVTESGSEVEPCDLIHPIHTPINGSDSEVEFDVLPHHTLTPVNRSSSEVQIHTRAIYGSEVELGELPHHTLTPVNRSGSEVQIHTRAKYGSEVELGELPHHVLIFEIFDAKKQFYRAFCAGSIIGEKKVLTSTHCFLTNKKNHRHDYKKVWVVAGIIQVSVRRSKGDEGPQQWRSIVKVYAQRYYRFPAYNLGLLIMNKPWVFNSNVKKIPYESEYHDFDGVCTATAVKATKSWAIIKYVFSEEVEMIKRLDCERILQRSCRHYFCTAYNNMNKYAYSETEGGGLICRETGDPSEVDPKQGILVGVTSIVNLGLPNLHMRVGPHTKWITDQSYKLIYDKFLLAYVIFIVTIL